MASCKNCHKFPWPFCKYHWALTGSLGFHAPHSHHSWIFDLHIYLRFLGIIVISLCITLQDLRVRIKTDQTCLPFSLIMKSPYFNHLVGDFQHKKQRNILGVSKNNGTPKSSILRGVSIINKPSILAGTTPYFWKHPYNLIISWIKSWMTQIGWQDLKLNDKNLVQTEIIPKVLCTDGAPLTAKTRVQLLGGGRDEDRIFWSFPREKLIPRVILRWLEVRRKGAASKHFRPSFWLFLEGPPKMFSKSTVYQ